MKALVGSGRMGRGWSGAMVAVALGLAPAGAWAWTHSGNSTVGGKLGVGTESPQRGIHLQSHAGIFEIDRDADPAAFLMVRTAEGDFNTVHKAYLFGVKGPGVNNGEFTIRDMGASAGGSGGTKRLTIANNGRFAFGELDAPLAALHVKSPAAGDLFRLDGTNGTKLLSVESDGDLYAMGADLELRLASNSSGGFYLGGMSTLLGNTSAGTGEESFLALNGNTAKICNPGYLGLLQLIDQDTFATNYVFWHNGIEMTEEGHCSIYNDRQGDGDYLIFSTTGEQMQFQADTDNNTGQDAAFTWYNGGTASTNKRMVLTAYEGNLRTDGSLSQNFAFDVAEAYWKSEEGIEAGEVVCIDPQQPNAVVRARTAGDRAVVGVVSTDPGIAMGGGAFSSEKLARLWGEEVAAQFAEERPELEKAVAVQEPVAGRAAKVKQMKQALAKKGASKEKDRLAAEVEQAQQELAGAVEEAALETFCQQHLAMVALAGRVPVKVDASYGAIQVGDALVASATPGHAMRSDNPGVCTMVGKALEPFASGQGTIMMLVLNR